MNRMRWRMILRKRMVELRLHAQDLVKILLGSLEVMSRVVVIGSK